MGDINHEGALSLIKKPTEQILVRFNLWTSSIELTLEKSSIRVFPMPTRIKRHSDNNTTLKIFLNPISYPQNIAPVVINAQMNMNLISRIMGDII